MAQEKKSWKGIRVNFAQFQGEVVSDPVNDNGYVFFTLRTKDVNRDPNGQYVELDLDVPMMVEPNGPTNTINNHVKIGRKLMAWCTYKNWLNGDTQCHAFVVKNVDLGDKPYEGPADGGGQQRHNGPF